jgi:hypothetical protein
MNRLSLFGLLAVSAMLICYALESRGAVFTFAFAAACAAGSVYGFLQGAWPFGCVELVWAMIAAIKGVRRVQGSANPSHAAPTSLPEP